MKHKVFIDGQAGTTGLRLAERLAERADIQLVEIDEARRKDPAARLACIADANISFLCLPDDEAADIAAAAPPEARIIDCSTAHRTAEGWAYGLPEIFGTGGIGGHTTKVANPGCHATGFILAMRPLVDAGIVDKDAALGFHSLTGYSGGGKAMIAEYESTAATNESTLSAPRQYALAQAHKHLPEIEKYSGLGHAPIFAPIVCDFYSGMMVGVPLPRSALRRPASVVIIRAALANYYAESQIVKVRELGAEHSEAAGAGFLSADAFANRDDIEVFVTGNDDRIEVVSRYDNLGKGASGAAIQNMNLMLGLPEGKGLSLGD
ncbi:MAG: N-acetyl-gamma-glutamyl-phosphate reductase [Clostridiales bacterium]|nr:N-acetyl-gamma-glutamyl-phosphate reductase [Clostridiales bacterium]